MESPVSFRTPLVLSLLIALTACSKSEPPASTAAPATAPTASAPAETTAPAPADTAPAPAAGITGIAECDDFLTAYEQCVTAKVPEQVRAQMQTGLDQWKSAWKGMAENPATQSSLPQMCKQARDSSLPALQAYGCTL